MDRIGVAALTDREKECLRLAGRGLEAAAIADELGRPINTVHRQIKSARAKLGGVRRSVAAQMLRAAEGDHQMVDQPIALFEPPQPTDEVREERPAFHFDLPVVPSEEALPTTPRNPLDRLQRALLIVGLIVLLGMLVLQILPLAQSADQLGRIAQRHR